MMTDPIADMFTRIRNANAIHKKNVSMPASRIKVGIASILQDEGFIQGYEVEAGKPASQLRIDLKYGPDGEYVIRRIDRVSKPGCRVYIKADELRPVLNGQGLQILTTPKGVVSDRKARELKIGGEVLGKVC